MDTSRFFPNPSACHGENEGKNQQQQQEKELKQQQQQQQEQQQQKWKPENCIKTAQQIMTNKCLLHYEGNSASYLNTTDGHDSLGSLYTGSLGPRVFLRLRMAQTLLLQQQQQPQQQKAVAATAAKQLLQESYEIVQKAVQYETRKFQKQRNHREQWGHLRLAFLTSPYIGAKTLLAAILATQQKPREAKVIAEEIVREFHELGCGCDGDPVTVVLSRGECEVLYGRAGMIQAILFLRRELNDETLGTDVVVTLAKHILREGKRLANERQLSVDVSVSSGSSRKKDTHGKRQKKRMQLPLLWEWHESYYLGAAHGIVGILHTLLSVTSTEYTSIVNDLEDNETKKKNKKRKEKEEDEEEEDHHHHKDIIHETICFLTDHLCWSSGNLRSSIPSSSRSKDKLVHWCHGAPGHLLLLMKAAEVYKDPTLYHQGQIIANQVVWPRGLLRKGVGLCHGISGNAYVFLSLARCCRNPNNTEPSSSSSSLSLSSSPSSSSSSSSSLGWISKAVYFADFAMNHLEDLENIPDRPYSIFEGAAGLALLFMDLGSSSPEQGRFPLYDF